MNIFSARSLIIVGVLDQGRRCALCIGLFSIVVLLEACTIKPMFPPEIMENIEASNFDVKAWQRQTYHPSSAGYVSHKVKLGGEIIAVIRKPEGVVLLVEEQPIENHPIYGSESVAREDSFWYAVAFNGSPESSMLQRGNKIVVVGMTDRGGTEMIGGAPRVVPRLRAQCLHIWNTRELEPAEFSYYGGAMGYHPPEERTFCLRDDPVKALSFDESQGNNSADNSG